MWKFVKNHYAVVMCILLIFIMVVAFAMSMSVQRFFNGEPCNKTVNDVAWVRSDGDGSELETNNGTYHDIDSYHYSSETGNLTYEYTCIRYAMCMPILFSMSLILLGTLLLMTVFLSYYRGKVKNDDNDK